MQGDRSAPTAAAASGAPDDVESRLLGVIADMLREVHGSAPSPPRLDDDLERGLGIDSLARMELMLRLEAAFQVQLPETLVQQAQTPRDLLRAVAAAAPRQQLEPRMRRPTPGPAGAAPDLPVLAETLLDVFDWHAQRTPQRVQVTVLGADDAEAQPLSHAALRERSRSVAAGLQHAGVQPGDRVALMLPTETAFFEAFAGILWAGAVPVPIYPPLRASQIEDHLRRQANILDNAQAVLLISDALVMPAARILRAAVGTLRAVTTVERLAAGALHWTPAPRGTQDIAFLQYTSGSTGQPKGVVLTHANLLANIRAMGRAVRAQPDDVFVSWLPLYHDMGLIGAWLAVIYHGLRLVVMPPQAFLARPSRWLRIVDEHRGTLSAAPNFAYEIVASRVPDDELQGLDLSRWRIAFNGAEPVHAATLQRFCERLAAHGFDAKAMMPVYGLAECGVGLAFPPLRRGPKVERIDRATLHVSGEARLLAADSSVAAMQVVCCGAPLAGHELRIVDPQGRELPERREGRIEFRGPSATSGYFRNAEATRALFDGDWLDTGDVGYIADGEVYLTSRAKDLIIRGGHNVHPYDLEVAVGNLAGVRKGCVAVFGARDPHGASERIVVLAETNLADATARAALRDRIAELSIAMLDLPADDIVLAEAYTVRKTSSGKIRRAACRELYEQGALARGGRALRWQIARLWLDAALRRLRRPARPLAAACHGAWMWAVFGICTLVGLAAMLLPVRRWRKHAARVAARLAVRGSLVPFRVSGAERFATHPAVIACNHASYADWLVLAAVLPAEACFVAKRELAVNPLLRWALPRLGTHLIERADVHGSVEDAKRLREAAAAGELLVFFPEGTFTRAPGLRGFHMGAFVTAAETALPLIPVSLAGTRSLLRAGSWWPRRHPVRVDVHEPIWPAGSSWSDALRLRDAARERIAKTCAEPVLPA